MKKQEFKRNQVVLETSVFKLNKFNNGTGTPVLIIPPHAGRSGNIAQKMIDKCVSCGKSTYAFELLSATHETSTTSIADLIDIINICQRWIGEPVDLIGLCQGGWLSSIYASRYPESVAKLALFAAPINTKTGQDNIIERYCQSASISFHKTMVAISNGMQSGLSQWLSFAMVDPTFVFLKRWLDLFNISLAGDAEKMEKWKYNNAWYDSPQDLAGVWFLDCLENHFIENRLYKGTWVVGGRTVDLGKIACPVYLYAGGNDDITHPQQVFDMENVLSITKKNIHKTLFEGAGHTSVFTRRENLNKFVGEFFN